MKAPIKFSQLLPKALILSLLALLAIGCGDSSDDFVVQNSQSNNGNLVFQFVRPQALNVPTATTTVRFDFYRANDVLDFTSEQPFAPTITFNDVSTSIVRVVVTPLDANGFPIQDVRNDIAVQPGQTITVNLSTAQTQDINYTGLELTPDPIRFTLTDENRDQGIDQQLTVNALFSDQSRHAVNPADVTFTGSPGVFGVPVPAQFRGAFNISSTGVLTLNPRSYLMSNMNITASYTIRNVAQQSTVPIEIRAFNLGKGAPTLSPGSDFSFPAFFFPDAMQRPQEVSAQTTFSVEPAVSGITFNGNTVSIGNSVPSGTTYTVVARYTNNGETFTTRRQFRVENE